MLISYVWPEPQSSAAGLRDLHLIEALSRAGYRVVIASAAQNKAGKDSCEYWASTRENLQVHPILLNHSSFDAWISELKPDLVIFDRFVTEEQFGWRVRQAYPKAVTILDTQDLHFLRASREEALRHEINAGRWERVVAGTPADWERDLVCRELAAIYRVDLAWLVSDFERQLLVDEFHLESRRLFVSRFAYPKRTWLDSAALEDFGARSGFVQLGNFRHPPNLDAFRWMRQQVWPRIRQLLPRAELHVFGAYPTQEVMEANDPRVGFRVHGPAPELSGVFEGRRVSLAPLRFGAGIKGKISDSWWHGVPVVSTSIGVEGMGSPKEWGGLIADDVESFAQSCVKLHESPSDWAQLRANAGRILDDQLSEQRFFTDLVQSVALAEESHRQSSRDWVRNMLNHSTLDAYRYFGKWLELKGDRREP